MLNRFLNFSPTELLISLPAIVIALTFHEFSHAYSAYLLGDNTARNMGRLSLNPMHHLDPIGFLCLMFFRFGWAKPVPVNPYNFRSVDEKTGMLLTAFAGPASNIILCFLSVGLIYLLPMRLFPVWVYSLLNYLVWINASLAFFNLIPVPPLDGSKILFGLLPYRMYSGLMVLEQYSSILLLILIISNIPSMVISPLSSGLVRSFQRFFMIFI